LVPLYNFCWNSNGHHVIGDVRDYRSASPNERALPDAHAGDRARADADLGERTDRDIAC
jgi:hypothetical protein